MWSQINTSTPNAVSWSTKQQSSYYNFVHDRFQLGHLTTRNGKMSMPILRMWWWKNSYTTPWSCSWVWRKRTNSNSWQAMRAVYPKSYWWNQAWSPCVRRCNPKGFVRPPHVWGRRVWLAIWCLTWYCNDRRYGCIQLQATANTNEYIWTQNIVEILVVLWLIFCNINTTSQIKQDILYLKQLRNTGQWAYAGFFNFIIYLSWSSAFCWPVPVSHIQKSLQRSAIIPSANWGIVFHYPG